jgi:hypothetical protein
MTRLNYKTAATIQIVLTAVAVTALSRNASAQEADPAAPPAAPAEEAPASRYPRSVIDRPLTLPKGLAMLGADLTANHDFSLIGAAPIIGYGFSDDFEAQLSYGFALEDFEAKGSLALDLGYKILRGALGGKFEMIGRVRGGYNALLEVANPIQVGLHMQYNATPKLAIISGVPGTEHLKITIDDGGTGVSPIDFSLPLGIGYQATKELYFQVDTKLFQIDIQDSANVLIGDDATPVSLTAVYNATPALDIQALIGTDLSNEPDNTLNFLVGFRYYAGQL